MPSEVARCSVSSHQMQHLYHLAAFSSYACLEEIWYEHLGGVDPRMQHREVFVMAAFLMDISSCWTFKKFSAEDLVLIFREADQVPVLLTDGYSMIGIRPSEFQCGYVVVSPTWSMAYLLVMAFYHLTVHESLFHRPHLFLNL